MPVERGPGCQGNDDRGCMSHKVIGKPGCQGYQRRGYRLKDSAAKMNINRAALVYLLTIVSRISAQCECPFEFIDPEANGHNQFFTPSKEIDLSGLGGITYYNTQYDSVYINEHGIVSFGEARDSATNFCEIPIPASNPDFGDWAAVFMYWFDVGFCLGAGYYTDPITTATDPALLDSLSGQIQACKGDSTFTASYAVVMTWENIGLQNCGDQEHTFQAVLLSDGTRSYIVRDYRKLQTKVDNSNQFAVVGFNAGDGIRGFKDPQSCSENVDSLVNETNVDCRGVFIERIDIPLQCDEPPLVLDYMTCDDYTRLDGDTITCTCNEGSMVVTGTDEDGAITLEGMEITLTCDIDSSTFTGATSVDVIGGIGCLPDCRGCHICPFSTTEEACDQNTQFILCNELADDCDSSESSASSHSSSHGSRRRRSGSRKSKQQKSKNKKKKTKKSKSSGSRSLSHVMDTEPMCVTAYRKESGQLQVGKFCSNGCFKGPYKFKNPGECTADEFQRYKSKRQACAEVSEPQCQAPIPP